jgi:hypothetical protein
LLRNTQGSYQKVLESGYILTTHNYENCLTDDIFIEYSYVTNFDSMNFEYYTSEGHQFNVKLEIDELEKCKNMFEN